MNICELGDMSKSQVICAHGDFACKCMCVNVRSKAHCCEEMDERKACHLAQASHSQASKMYQKMRWMDGGVER